MTVLTTARLDGLARLEIAAWEQLDRLLTAGGMPESSGGGECITVHAANMDRPNI